MFEFILFIIWLIQAFFFGKIASERGSSFKIWFAICFLLGPIGWFMMYVVIPPERKRYQ